MNLKEQNILFFTRTMNLGGTENVVLQLCEVFKPLVNKIVVCSCGGVNVTKLIEIGIKHYEIPDIENKSPLIVINVLGAILNIVRKENITIVHTHHRMAAFYVSLLRLHNRCYFFNTCHNTFNDKIVLTNFAYRHANLIVCGEMVKKNLMDQFGIDSDRVTVIQNSIKPFDKRIETNLLIKELHEKGNFIIGNVGRLTKQKGMEYYIRAIPKVVKEHPNTKFLIIGSGEDLDKLKQLAKDIGIEDYIIFTGYQSDVQNIMAQLDLVVLSSLWEGFPLTVIEAFSVGKTIIATAVDGTIEIVEDGKSGFLVAAQNSNQIADKINWLIENSEEKIKMECAAKKRFLIKFSFDKFAELYIDCYKNCIRSDYY